MQNLWSKKLPLWGLVALAAFGAQSAQALLIDNFNAGLVDLTANALDTVARDEVAVAGVLGGERETTVYYDAAHSDASDDVSLRVNFNGSANFSHHQDASVAGLSFIAYDGEADDSIVGGLDVGIDETGLGGIDLTEGGLSDSFILTVLFADHTVENVLGVRVYTDENNYSDLFIDIPEEIGSTTKIFLPYADFVMASGAAGAADFTNVGAIVLAVDGRLQQAFDVRLDQFETNVIPEPATMSLFAIGAGMLGFVGRRRRLRQDGRATV